MHEGDPVLANDTLIGERYKIVRLIGIGGMGAVYEAMDQRLGRRIALKQRTVRGEKFEQAYARLINTAQEQPDDT